MSIKGTIKGMIPNIHFCRKLITEMEYKKYLNKLMPSADIDRAQEDPAEKSRLTAAFAEAHPVLTGKIDAKIDAILNNAPAYAGITDERRAFLKEDIRFCRFAYGFEADEYLCFNLEGKSRAEREAFISEIDRVLYIHQTNDVVAFEIYDNKYRAYEKLKPYFKRDAMFLSKNSYEEFCSFIEKHPKFVKKVVSLACGESIGLVDASAPECDRKLLFEALRSEGEVILEEPIVQSEQMSKLNESSCNTIRLMTFHTEKGIVTPFAFLKMGRSGSFVDNAAKGGVLVGLDPETGISITDGHNEYNEVFMTHPDHGYQLRGIQLPDWQQAVQLCKSLASKENNVKYIGWDLAHTDNGWVVVETNPGGQFIVPQIVLGRGIKKDILAVMADMKLWA